MMTDLCRDQVLLYIIFHQQSCAHDVGSEQDRSTIHDKMGMPPSD